MEYSYDVVSKRKDAEMNADQMTFGVELEITLPASTNIHVGGYHRGVSNAHLGLPVGWNVQSDCSIRPATGRIGCEVVSPVLSGTDGLHQIVRVCEVLSRLGASVNPSCGFHVHIGWDAADKAGLQRIINTVANFEDAIYATTGTRNRQDGHYCKSVRRDFRGIDVQTGARAAAGEDRYHLLNISNLLRGSKPTVEFRAFAGTVNANKAIAYVRMCLAIAERAATDKKAAKWEAPLPTGRSPMLRKIGHGYTQLTRLLYHVGWVKGRVHRTFGNVVADGLPTIDDSKAELRRLAKKFDTTAQ